MRKRIKILAVCGFGVGTSLILGMNIEKVLKENNLDAEVEHLDVTTAAGAAADLVVCSKEIAGQLENRVKAPLIVIGNFMNLEEIKEKCVEVVRAMQQEKGE